MFKTRTGMAALALFTTDAMAVKIGFRPIDGTVPWHEGPKLPEWVDPKDYPINYFVPHFGVDSDILANQQHTAQAEGLLSHTMKATFKKPDAPKRDYFVPHFGEEEDIITTKEHIAAAEKEAKHELKATFAAPKGHPMNYFVPNFGEDNEISASKKNTVFAEKVMGHNLEASFDKPPPPKRDYFVPHFGEDEDILDAKAHIRGAEKSLKHKWEPERDGDGSWNLPGELSSEYGNYKAEQGLAISALTQTDSNIQTSSDPICSSAGCTQYKHPGGKLGYDINYGVPHFGADIDINDSKASLALAEAQAGHKWEFGTAASKKKWHNVAKDTLYNFAPRYDGEIDASLKNLADAQKKLNHKWDIEDLQTEQQINTESDPICSSAGCDHKAKKLGYPIDYGVPNFGVDHLIN